MSKRKYNRLYDLEDLLDQPKSSGLEYDALSGAQEDWCDKIMADPRANSAELGRRVLFAHQTARFPEAVTVFVTHETDVTDDYKAYPDYALASSRERIEVVYVRTPATDEPSPLVSPEVLDEIETEIQSESEPDETE